MQLISLTCIAVVVLGVPQKASAQGTKQGLECAIEDVAVYADRIVIHCDNKGGKLSPTKYFAVVASSPVAPLVLELGLASLKRKVKIYFIDDASLNPPGCVPANCRMLQGIVAFDR